MSSTDIESYGFPWAFSDTLRTALRNCDGPIVVNTDVKGNPGVHWITIVLLSDGTRYVYDPLGPDNDRVTSLGVSVDRYLITRDTHVYPYKSQIVTTSHCGWFALFVARRIKKYMTKHPECTASDLDKLITVYFGRSADWSDVKKLQKEFN